MGGNYWTFAEWYGEGLTGLGAFDAKLGVFIDDGFVPVLPRLGCSGFWGWALTGRKFGWFDWS